MSLSKPTNTNTNPAVKFFQWSGEEGKVKYYDKEKGENIFVKLPFNFIVLDKLSTVTGYSDADQSGYWSNEVRSLKEPFTVKTKSGVKREGLWGDIGEGLKAQGAKFACSIYIAAINKKKELELCNIKFFGSSITEWIEFLKVNKGHGVSVSGNNEAKKGKNTYYTPVFEPLEVTDEQLEEATKLDETLQIYLDSYFDYRKSNQNEYSKEEVGETEKVENKVEENTEEEDDTDIPF